LKPSTLLPRTASKDLAKENGAYETLQVRSIKGIFSLICGCYTHGPSWDWISFTERRSEKGKKFIIDSPNAYRIYLANIIWER